MQHVEALCAEVVRRLEESLAGRFVTPEALAAHAARAADDSEELRGFANSLLVASRAETAKVTDELAAQVASLQSIQQSVMTEAVAAEVGQRIGCAGFDGEPDEVLNPKKKVWDQVVVDLMTDEARKACFRGVPLTVNGQPCTVASISKGTIK